MRSITLSQMRLYKTKSNGTELVLLKVPLQVPRASFLRATSAPPPLSLPANSSQLNATSVRKAFLMSLRPRNPLPCFGYPLSGVHTSTVAPPLQCCLLE